MTSEETARFTAAKERIIGKNRERNGIGTLSEKTVHAVLKNYYAPDETQHEIPVEGCVADIFNGKEIIEIQTRSFDRMRPKLERFLPLYPVTIVYPIPYCKHVFWIDEETGEISGGRKSPLKGSPYLAFNVSDGSGRYDPLDIASLQLWQQGQQEDNRQQIRRLLVNLPLAVEEELTPRQRQLLRMHFTQGKRVTDIAQELGISKSTVSRTLARCTQRLYRTLRYSL